MVRTSFGWLGLVALLALHFPCNDSRADTSFQSIYRFWGPNGAGPEGGLIDINGSLYGTTYAGGEFGYGTVFVIAHDRTETLLHSFSGGSDGDLPSGGVLADRAGNLYGTTSLGGDGSDFGGGTVFRLAPDGSETLLHIFHGGSDGQRPSGGLIADAGGNLYGATAEGGAGCVDSHGCGTVFKIAPDGTETILYALRGGSDGAVPEAGLVMDRTGNLYGTTGVGGGTGCYSFGCGTVFKLGVDGSETILHVFTGGSDGDIPASALIMDGTGNLYGTTRFGGGSGCGGDGCGTVFRIAPDGAETRIHVFAGDDGRQPLGPLAMDHDGNLYGATVNGGTVCHRGHGCGVVFKLAPDGSFTVLHAFNHRDMGPVSVTLTKSGNLVGTTDAYNRGKRGTIFRIRP